MKTPRLRFSVLHRLMAICALALGLGMVAAAAKGGTVWLASFTIDDGWSPSNAVFGDGLGKYDDYRLGSGLETDPNFCVEASPFSGGDLFVRLNRKLDGDTGFMRCDTPNHDYGAGKQRQFSLVIMSDSACWELGSNGYLSPDSTTWHAGCTMTGGPNPRIRIGNLWARNARTGMDFLTTNPSGGSVTYVVESDSNATILVGPGETRVATYGGTARLHKFAPNSVGTVADPFPLPFHMTFVRSAQ